MKKSLILWLLVLLMGCRTEENFLERDKKADLLNRFLSFTSKSVNEEIDYRKGFEKLFLRYDSLHQKNFMGRREVEKLKDKHNLKFSDFEKVEFIDFKVHSQLIEEENGDKIMIFPKVKGGKVIDLVIIKLINNGTLLGRYEFDKNDEIYRVVLNQFSQIYQKRFVELINFRKNLYSVFGNETEIDGVVIVKPRPNKPLPSGPALSLITCEDVGECLKDVSLPDDVGGSPPPPNPPKDPCEKLSKIGKDNTTKEKMKELQAKTKEKKEIGYVLEGGSFGIFPHYVKGNLNQPFIRFELTGQIDGFVHSHYQGLLSVFSVSDIFGLAAMYKNGNIRDVNTFVMGLVTDAGTQYMMVIDDPEKFAAFANSGLFSGNQVDEEMQDFYERIYEGFGINIDNSSIQNENSFVNYLRVNNTGLKLIKGNKDLSRWELLGQDSDGNITKDECK